jgi:hypothetical protein
MHANAYAQNASQYTFTAQASTFTQITGTAVPSILSDDASSAMLPIGFNFTFCGVTYSQFMVSSNGWLSFINTGGNYRINQDPAQVASISPALMPLWDDLDMGTAWGGAAVYNVTGTPGSQIFTMQWLNAAWDYAADVTSVSFQIKLYEGTNVIEFYYRQEANAPFIQFSGGATIGILRNSTDFLVLNNVSTSPTTNTSSFIVDLLTRPATGQMYRFSPPAPCSGQPLAGTATAANTAFNCSGIPSLNLTGGTVATGITYTWESSPNGSAPWTVVPGASGLTNPAFIVGTPITSTTYYRVVTTCAGGGVNQSVPVQITVTPASAPVVTSPVNINCGDAASLSATPVPGGYMNWFTTPTGGAPFATGNTVSVSPTTNTTYYAEKFFPVTAINTTGATIIDHDALSGDDRGGVAVSANYAYVTGDNANGTIRYNKNTLTGGTAYPRMDGLFSDIMTQRLWVIGTSATTSYSNSAPATITHIFEVDENLAPTGVAYPLSQTFGTGSGRFIAPGYGFLIFYSGGTFYRISLANGAVTTVGTGTMTFSGSESWASWGWSEFDGTNYYVYHVQNSTTISKRNLTTGAVTTIQSFSNLSDMASIAYNVATNRMYFHYEGSSQFGGSAETLGFLAVTSDNNCGYGIRTPLVVNVIPPTVTISTTPATICLGENATTTFTGTPNSTVTYNINGGSNQNIVLDGSGQYILTQSPTVNTTYNLVSVVSGSCSGAMTGSSSVVVNPRPNGQLINNTLTVCKDAPANIGFATASTAFPIYVTFTDGTNSYTDTANVSGELFPVPSSVPGNYNFQITSINNQYGCAGIPVTDYPTGNTATVLVNDRPTATLTSVDPGVCPSGSTDVTITFTGTPPYIFEYSDGTTPTSPAPEFTNSYTFSVSPTVNTTYFMTQLLDGTNCPVLPADIDDSVTIEAWINTAITSQPINPNSCHGTPGSMTVAATGSNLTYQWYQGVTALVDDATYTGTNTPTLSISDVTGLNNNEYTVVVTGSCGSPITSDIVTLTENFNNTWTGTVNNDWSNSSNWGCGIVPTSETNAVIPDVTNDPIVDVPTAVCKDLLIDANATVTFTGTGNQLSIFGNIVNNGTLNGTGGTVQLAGTTQSITGATTYGDLEVTGGGTKSLGSNATVNGLLTLTNGYLALGSSNLTIADMDLQSTGSSTSFIVTDGSGEVIGQNMGTAARTFHVGISGSSYTPVTIENTGDADTFNVRVMSGVFVDGYGVNPATVTNPVVNRTWMISEQTLGGSNATITPQWNAGEEINGFDLAHVFVAHYMGGEWTSTVASAATAPAAQGTNPYTTTETGVTSFSPFTVASSGQFPLAIRLGSITATNVGARNKVQWKSETEDAGDMYELESSADGRKFTKIATIAANGIPSTYVQWDEHPVTGVNYYRVKLLNNDGTHSYSKVVSATVKGTEGFAIEAYPNPVKNVVSVKVDGVVTGKGTVVVTDVTGKVVKSATEVKDNGAEINVSDLASGVYLLNYTDDVRNESIKITKQ